MPPLLALFLNYARQQAHRRVFWLLLTLLTSALLAFIQAQFNGSDIHALTTQYVGTDINPTDVTRTWPAERNVLAWLEVGIDTLLFLPAYVIALAAWCQYFSAHSLFVSNPYRPYLKQVMQQAGRWITVGLLVGAVADLIENATMAGWLTGRAGWVSPNWMLGLLVLKFGPVLLAAFFILLHPLGILYSLREAAFRFVGLNRYSQEDARSGLMDHIHKRRQADLGIWKAVARLRADKGPRPPRTLTVGEYVGTLWKGFLNVQFIVYLLLFMGGVFQLDQFDELFYSLITVKYGKWVFIWTMLTLCLWSGMVYVCSKILLFIQPNYFQGVDPGRVDSTARELDKIDAELVLLRNTPLWLSQGPFLLLFLTLVLNFGRLSASGQQTPDFTTSYVTMLLVLALVYVLFTTLIRRIHYYTDEATPPEQRGAFALFKPDTPANDYALLLDRAPYSILYGQGLLVTLMLLFLPTATGLWLSKGIGLYAVVMLWLAGLAYMGTLLYQVNQLPKYPATVLLVVAVLVFSRFNDNTDIRKSPVTLNAATGDPDTSAAMKRPDIATYYARWLATRRPVGDTAPLPVVVVATAGGGIRAAAWTTEVMAELNRQIPGFDRHVFAISGVSGGGVGAATYVATLGGQPPGNPHTDSLLIRLRSVVTDDLISPAVASTLFRGGIHNFLPLPVTALDRNRWLEDAWEKRLLTRINLPVDSVRGHLTESFLSLWPTKQTLARAPLDLPALLLNGAVAETGQKVVMTNLDLGNTADRRNPFFDVADLFASTGHDVPYKTATFLCARFPFVTSGGRATGTLPNITSNYRQTSYHIIDGGYAENTGILTAVQLIKQLQRVTGEVVRPGSVRVAYYLLFLPNYAASEEKGSVGTFRFLAEPVKGFLNTWNRNGVSLDQLIGRTLQDSSRALSFEYISLTLNTKAHRYPLGWYISPGAVCKMNEQIRANVGVHLRSPASLLRQLAGRVNDPRKRLMIRPAPPCDTDP